jgi:hypothetical protein
MAPERGAGALASTAPPAVEPSASRQCGPAPWVPIWRPAASNSVASGARNTQAGPASRASQA